MDNVSHTFQETAQHEDVVSFEQAASRKSDASRAAVQPIASTCGEGWYHDAAIASARQDAIEARSNPYHH